MAYSLYREDRAGDSGPMSNIFRKNPETGELEQKPGRPTIGWGIQVGSPFGRTYSSQDWWATTPVTEIVSETEDETIFKTRSGSTYTWRK